MKKMTEWKLYFRPILKSALVVGWLCQNRPSMWNWPSILELDLDQEPTLDLSPTYNYIYIYIYIYIYMEINNNIYKFDCCLHFISRSIYIYISSKKIVISHNKRYVTYITVIRKRKNMIKLNQWIMDCICTHY